MLGYCIYVCWVSHDSGRFSSSSLFTWRLASLYFNARRWCVVAFASVRSSTFLSYSITNVIGFISPAVPRHPSVWSIFNAIQVESSGVYHGCVSRERFPPSFTFPHPTSIRALYPVTMGWCAPGTLSHSALVLHTLSNHPFSLELFFSSLDISTNAMVTFFLHLLNPRINYRWSRIV